MDLQCFQMCQICHVFVVVLNQNFDDRLNNVVRTFRMHIQDIYTTVYNTLSTLVVYILFITYITNKSLKINELKDGLIIHVRFIDAMKIHD